MAWVAQGSLFSTVRPVSSPAVYTLSPSTASVTRLTRSGGVPVSNLDTRAPTKTLPNKDPQPP
jgi:hypothetical protein